MGPARSAEPPHVAGGRPIERQAGAAPRGRPQRQARTASGKGSGRESNIVWVGTLASLTASLGTAVLGALGISWSAGYPTGPRPCC